MAEVFIGPPPGPAHKWVKPIDGNIDNVTPENLVWTHGYPVSRLYLGETLSTTQKTHTLVAESFLGRRPSASHVVNHKDRNKQNNRLENLEWSTYRENTKHWASNRG